MVCAELTRSAREPADAQSARRSVRAAAGATGALCALTAAAAIAGALDPRLLSATPPHPTLRPTVAAWAAVLVSNARLLALPFLLAACGFGRGRWSRLIADAAVIGVLGANGVRVGLALGRWQTQLLAYLPHLPLEWTALGVAAGAWVQARTGRPADCTAARLLAQAAVTVALLAAGAAIEVLLTPHAPGRAR